MKRVKVQDVINHLVSRVESGEAFSSIMRSCGNIADNNGNEYTLIITLTSDEDEMDYEADLVNSIINGGLCITDDPQDIFKES